MKLPYAGAIDCDVHAAVPHVKALLPYMDEYWQEQIVGRYLDRPAYNMTSYPPSAPFSARSDQRGAGGPPGSDIELLRRQVLDETGSRIAIVNTLHGAVTFFQEDMAAVFCAAVNDWTRAHVLDRDPRLRGSILVTPQNPSNAVREIERVADDPRFVQVLVLAMNDMMLGRRVLWPIYEAAERHGLVLAIHAGSMHRYPSTASGYPSYQVEDYIHQGNAFESQLVSLLAEGVFQRFPDLTVVLAESGFAWMPTLMWRVGKTWRGARSETPWVDRIPADIFRERVRITLQPIDTPDGDTLSRTLEHIGSDDVLLFSSDWPHWHYDGDDVLPDGLSETQIRKILIDNPLSTYPRLAGLSPDDGAAPRNLETAR